MEEICAALAENEKAYEEGRKTKKEHDDFKAKHKSLLPAFLLQGTPKDGRRKSQAGYTPSGLAMMDYDGLPRPQEYFEQKIQPLLKRPDIRICWVHVTPSGRGLRIVFRIPSGCPSIEAAQRWMGEQLGDTSYDACVKDITRLSLKSGALTDGTYYIRVRNRNDNLLWSDYSAPEKFTVTGSTAQSALSLDGHFFRTGSELEFSYAGAPVGTDAWVGIYVYGKTPGTADLSYKYAYTDAASGTWRCTIDEPGAYFAVLF